MKRRLLIIPIILLLIACEKDVVMDLTPDEGNLLVVEANLTNEDTAQVIRLSLTADFYNENPPAAVTQAAVSVFINDDEYIFEHSNDSSGYYVYEDTWMPEIGDDFRLRILHEDEEYTAESKLRPVIELDSISFEVNPFSAAFGAGNNFDIVAHFAKINTGEINHFLFNYYHNGNLKTPNPRDKAVASDETISSYASVGVQTFDIQDKEDEDEITLEVRSISKKNLEFYEIFFNQTDLSGNPFAGPPPANLPTNISNGARGFFQVSAVSKASRTINLSELQED